MAFVFAAVGCVNEDPVYIEPGNPVTTETGYLTMSSIGLYVVSDSMTDQNTEHSPASCRPVAAAWRPIIGRARLAVRKRRMRTDTS